MPTDPTSRTPDRDLGGGQDRRHTGVALTYLAGCWMLSGRTVGAALMGVKVVAADTIVLRPLPASLRAVACVLFPIGLVWVAVDPDRRSAQDILLRTRVVYAA